MQEHSLRFSVPPFICASSFSLSSSLTTWGEGLASSLSIELTDLLEQTKRQALADYCQRPRGTATVQVAPFNITPWQVVRGGTCKILAVPAPPLGIAKAKTTVVAAPPGLVLMSQTEVDSLTAQIASLVSEVDRLKLALEQEISDHQKTRNSIRPITPIYEISDSLEPVALTPFASSVRPSTPAQPSEPPVETCETAAQTEETPVLPVRPAEMETWDEICLHAEFPQKLEELMNSKLQQEREYLRVHEEFKMWRLAGMQETAELRKRLTESEGIDAGLREQVLELEERRLGLQFEIDDLRSKFATTVEFADSLFQELERTKKFESLATDAKYEIDTLKTFLKNLEWVATENEKQITEFNSTFASAKDNLASAVRTFTAEMDCRPRSQKTFAAAGISAVPPNRWTTASWPTRHTFPALPPVENSKKKLWRAELEVADTPRKL